MRMARHWRRPGRPVLLGALALLSACGGDGTTPAPTPTPTATPTTVTVTPASATPTTADTLGVTIAVAGATTDGTVTLTSGAYTAAATTVSGGRASLTVPAGVLAIGSDTLTARFQPSAAGSAAVTGSATVTVAAATAPTVTAQTVAGLTTNGHPFAALPVDGGLIVSVSANTDPGSQSGLRVFAGATPAQLAFKCFQPISYPNLNAVTSALGLAATPVGTGLALAVEDAGIVLLNRTATTASCSGTPTQVSQGSLGSRQGSFDVAVTPDGKYAFVANEYGVVANDSNGTAIQGNVGVVALSYDASGVPTGGRLVGQIATGGAAIAGVTLSPDGRRLYVTSEVMQPGVTVSGTGSTVLAHSGCTQGAGQPTTTYGLLSVIDVAKAEAAPGASAIVATSAAGCSPVRSVVSADGETVWVAARGDNRVLAFAARTLETTPDNALLGYGDTGGIAPVGLALFGGGKLLAVANSNRFASPAAVGNMTVLQALPVRPSVLQTVAASYFPRSIGVAGDGTTLFLTDYDGGTVQVIATSAR